MKTMTAGKVMSLGLALEVATAGNLILPYSVMKNGDGKGGSSYPSMEGGESRWSMSLNPAMKTAAAGNVISTYHVMKITTMGNLLS